MMTLGDVLRVKRAIWPANPVRPVRIYAVLDCARDPLIHDLIGRTYREKSCLFAGTLHPEVERAAPFLVELSPKDGFTDEILQRGWHDAWGILIRTESSFRSLRRHLRTLLRVRTEAGRIHLFRFYDPRVLRTYLPTCTPAELDLIFGDAITEVFAASGNPLTAQKYTLQNAQLMAEPLAAEEAPFAAVKLSPQVQQTPR